MSLISDFFIRISSKKLGEDKFGNRYYESKKCDYLGRVKRQVIYNGKVEATKIPPIWHAWLHYMIDQIPENNNNFFWQQEYSPNLSGTKLASKTLENLGSKVKYSKWQPQLGK